MKLINRFGFVREIKKDVEETRTIEFIISNSTRDRHGTVLDVNNWDLSNYKLNPIVGYQHNVYGTYNPDPDYVIGSGNPYIENDNLISGVKFEPEKINKLAEKIFQKVLIGTLRVASVGFLPKGKGNYGKDSEGPGEENETYYYAGQELLEWSIVNISSNPTATKRAIFEQFGNILREYFKPDELDKMTVSELLNYSEAIENEKRIDEEIDERPYPNEHAARIRKPEDFDQKSFRRKNIETGIDIIIGKLKGETTTTTQAYRFKKDKFTVAEAKKWLKDHDIKYISFEAASDSKDYEKMKMEIDLINI